MQSLSIKLDVGYIWDMTIVTFAEQEFDIAICSLKWTDITSLQIISNRIL